MPELIWKTKELPAEEKVEALQQALPSISRESVQLLIGRGIETFEEAKSFFTPQTTQIHDPFLMKGMDVAVDRLSEAVSLGEKILIYGDYDVDGTTSVSLMYLFLKEISTEVEYYIPDRYKEGYGVSKQGIEHAIEKNVSLIISVDCGVRATDRIRQAKDAGIDFIVCDHHEAPDILPEALAILDPKQKDCHYPYKELCGCGVAFKLLQAFCDQQTIDQELLFKYLDLVAIATCSDIVAITGENRVLVNLGLAKLNQSPLPGVASLIEKAGYASEYNVRSVVFGLGPRINAAGRIGHAFGAVELLTSCSIKEAKPFAEEIEQYNQERRTIDKSITEEVLSIIAASKTLKEKSTTVLVDESWHKGVIGIVASRTIETYHRPTIIFTKSEGLLTGSARSVGQFNILEAITACDDLLVKYGGHKFAAGLSLEEKNFDAFANRFEEVVSSTISKEDLISYLSIEMELPLERINFPFLGILKRMEPFGPENMQPVFMTTGVKLKGEPRLLKEEHLKFAIETPSGQVDCIAFGMKEHFQTIQQTSFDIAYSLEENEYRGVKSLQLMVRGIR